MISVRFFVCYTGANRLGPFLYGNVYIMLLLFVRQFKRSRLRARNSLTQSMQNMRIGSPHNLLTIHVATFAPFIPLEVAVEFLGAYPQGLPSGTPHFRNHCLPMRGEGLG